MITIIIIVIVTLIQNCHINFDEVVCGVRSAVSGDRSWVMGGLKIGDRRATESNRRLEKCRRKLKEEILFIFSFCCFSFNFHLMPATAQRQKTLAKRAPLAHSIRSDHDCDYDRDNDHGYDHNGVGLRKN